VRRAHLASALRLSSQRLLKIPADFWFLNPPKSPFFKGGLSKEFPQIPPFGKGGIGGILVLGLCSIEAKPYGIIIKNPNFWLEAES
jgi:hypothetical protein